MNYTNVTFTSLCQVYFYDIGKYWLYRMADVIDGELCEPVKSLRYEKNYENRETIYRGDGPSEEGTIGIWDWTEYELNKIHTRYAVELKPVRVITHKFAKSIDDIISELKLGNISTNSYICGNVLFCYKTHSGKTAGVLCSEKDFSINNNRAKLLDNVLCLPFYEVSEADLFIFDDQLQFIKKLEIPSPEKYIIVGNVEEKIKDLVLARFSWPLFKENIGATKSEWRICKELLQKIFENNIYQEVASSLNCSLAMAEQAVDDFIIKANRNIDAGDVDKEVLAKLVMNHSQLNALCEEAAASAWMENHSKEVDAANSALESVKNETAEAFRQKNKLDEETKHLQEKLDQLTSDVERYEALGEDTLAAVRNKIAVAQKDMAGFISDLSVFLPQKEPAAPIENKTSLLNYCSSATQCFDEEEIETHDTWEDEFNTFLCNLGESFGVDIELRALTASFLYAAHITKTPLLIAGPGGSLLAEAMSMSFYSQSAGVLTFGQEYSFGAVDLLNKQKENIIVVEGMFGKGWSDNYPNELLNLSKKYMFWTHPYAEDLVMEPKGLYNYMYPVFSESFVENLSYIIPIPGKRTGDFDACKTVKAAPLRIAALRKLGLSKFFMNRMELLLTNAKHILDDETKDKDLEILFGLLPLCILTGKRDLLEEVLDKEQGLSSAVKKEVKRYIGEE